MLIALAVVTGGVVLAGVALFMMELARYRADRRPAPPLAAEEAARDRWSTLILDLVALMSILAAIISWQATVTFGGASAIDAQGLQETQQYQAAAAQYDSIIAFDQRLAQLVQQHEVAAVADSTQSLLTNDQMLAQLLQAEARVELAQAQAFGSGGLAINTIHVDLSNGGRTTFDLAAAEALAREFSSALRTLDPATHLAALTAQANTVRAQGQKLVLAGGLLALSIFCWTIARLGWRHRRLTAAAPGLVAMLASYAMLLVAAFSA